MFFLSFFGKELHLLVNVVEKLLASAKNCPVELHVFDSNEGALERFSDNPAVKEYTGSIMEIVDSINDIRQIAANRNEKMQRGESIDDEPLIVVILNDTKAAEIIEKNETAKSSFNELVTLYSKCKVSFIFTNVPNVTLTPSSARVYMMLRNSANLIFFEDMVNIKFISIPNSIVNQAKKKNGKGDAYYAKGNKLIKTKTMEWK